MGFTTGFTGGAALTLSLAYLAVLTHQRNRQTQSDFLRAQAAVLDGFTRPITAPSGTAADQPRQVSRPRTSENGGLVQTAKDRWNAELEGAVRWAQEKDWAGVREGAEVAVGRLLGREGVASREGGAPVHHEAGAVRRAVSDTAHSVSAGAGEALAEVKARSARAADAVHVKAEEAKAAVVRGVEKGKELVGKAKARIELAEERMESRADAKLLGVSEVEKALNERFQKSDAMERSVEEVLSERYKPIGERDNTRLRGL